MNRPLVAARRGRPKKYGRPARAISLTLPEDVLTRLGGVDSDLGRAIVKLVQRRTTRAARPVRPAEIAEYGKHAVIVVSPARALGKLPGVHLVPVGNGGYLIALKPPHSISDLELDIRDALAGGGLVGSERQTLEAVAEILRNARGSRRSYTQERTIIVFENRRSERKRNPARYTMLRRNDHT